MAERWPERSLSNPAIDRPAGEKFEDFVAIIRRELNPNHGNQCSQENIARLLCRTYNLKPPILEVKINTFLDVVGIKQETTPTGVDSSYLYNHNHQWQINIRPCHSYEKSREIFHEIWEILFWRCFHCIDWWKDWAVSVGYDMPHDKADEFAYLTLLSPQSVSAQSKKRRYNVYAIAEYYAVPTTLAFRALQNLSKFSHPTLMALINLNAKLPLPQKLTAQDALFELDQPVKVVNAQVNKKVFRKGVEPYSEEQLSQEQLKSKWQIEKSFFKLSNHLRKNNFLTLDAEDPIYIYCRQTEPRRWNILHLFGLDLPSELCLVIRQSPRNCDELFLQIVPVDCDKPFMPVEIPFWALTNAQERICQAEFQKAARSLQTNAARRRPT